MSGMDGPILTGVARFLGSLAAKPVSILTRKVLFKYMVASRVRKEVEFPCSWRAYRAWLKTLRNEDRSAPVEEVSGTLAIRLDHYMSEKSKEWRSADDHLSRALRLVELTYPAMAAALGDADRAHVMAAWSQQRNAQIRERLLRLEGPGAALRPRFRMAGVSAMPDLPVWGRLRARDRGFGA